MRGVIGPTGRPEFSNKERSTAARISLRNHRIEVIDRAERRQRWFANHGGGAVWHQRRVLHETSASRMERLAPLPISGTFVCIEVMADPAQPPSAVRRPSAGLPQPIR